MVHIVLIPGFAGFDALGQLEYYAGVTPIFQAAHTPRTALHYFDNLPTASVATRAGRLRRFLAKRLARGEVAPGDEIVLAGHSTGGLDIRRLLLDLHGMGDEHVPVDGGREITASAILRSVRRVVFLSVPHWGTNLADWVRTRRVERIAVVDALRALAAGSEAPALDVVLPWIAGRLAGISGAGLFRAIEDALTEADVLRAGDDIDRVAGAQEAAAALEQYLRHIAWDFGAIDDLTSQPPEGGSASPAHFSKDKRARERRIWESLGIDARSYVTLGRPPAEEHGDVDIVYRALYGACSGGPFQGPDPDDEVFQGIETSDSDGIVNTRSMFWRPGDHVLVRADHMDIVGHYRPVHAPHGSGRTYQAYDLLKSASGFGVRQFAETWNEIFALCGERAAAGACCAA